MNFKVLPLMACISLTSCTSITPPENTVKLPETFRNSTDNAELQNQNWWQTLPDENLNHYIKLLLKENLELAATKARLSQAYARYDIANAGFFPTIGGSISGSRNSIVGQGNAFNVGGKRYFNTTNAGLSAQWEIDIFGRIRNSSAASRLQAEAVVADLAAVKQALIAEFTRQYILAASQQQQIKVTKNILETRQRALQVVELRYRSGLTNTSAGDVHGARLNVFSSKATLKQQRQQLRETHYTMAQLLGTTPKTHPIDFTLKSLPAEIPTAVPASLLDSRPDLAASQLRVLASQYDINMAVADLYPSLLLSGSVGFQDQNFADLFDAEQMVINIAASLTARLFEGGRLRANIRLQEAEAEELIANYTNSILEAVADVEVTLSQEKTARLQLEDTQKTVDAARHREDIALRRYQRGVGDFLNVTTAQEQRAAAEQELVNVYNAIWQSRVALYLALGGNW